MSSSRSQQGGRVAEPPPPADVGIVAALPIEIGPFLASLLEVRKYSSDRVTVHEGVHGEKLVAVIVSGPGREAAARAGRVLLAGHNPRWLISAGFAGALTRDLARGAVILPDEVIDPEGDRVRIDVEVKDGPGGTDVRSGPLVTVDAIVRTVAEKAALQEASGAICVDMETSALAKLAAERNRRFLAVRVISDDAGSDLPPEILSIVGPSGGYRVGAAIGALWKRPSSMKELLRLRGHAHRAAETLSSVLRWVIPRLN
jgi:adenosylhomocysteine nucleosidase